MPQVWGGAHDSVSNKLPSQVCVLISGTHSGQQGIPRMLLCPVPHSCFLAPGVTSTSGPLSRLFKALRRIQAFKGAVIAPNYKDLFTRLGLVCLVTQHLKECLARSRVSEHFCSVEELTLLLCSSKLNLRGSLT